MKLIGPFSQILTLADLALRGALKDLQVIENGGVIVDADKIVAVGDFEVLRRQCADVDFISTPAVLVPGFIDCHTHICYDGSRNRDYAMRIAGHSYLDIARAGGGIWDSVTKTRAAGIE